jgi:general secretion pathway protein K
MGSTQRSENRSERGIALFMVIAAMTVLSLLVTEFVYIAQVNQRMAFDGLDQVRALYLAKTGYKISLLRLNAYKQAKATVTDPNFQKQLDQIWSLPLPFPFPKTLPGLTMTQRDAIEKFEKESSLSGSFTATITSESARFNLNWILPAYVSRASKDKQTPAPPFEREKALKSLQDLFEDLHFRKAQDDPAFADEYRDFNAAELTDNIAAWADATYEKRGRWGSETIPPKKAPFYSIQELHMIPGMDDTLFDVFAPSLTVGPTTSINANTMGASTFHALFRDASNDEIKELIKERDGEEGGSVEGKTYKDPKEFFERVKSKLAAYQTREPEKELSERGIQIVTEERIFRIRVKAQVNQSVRRLEAVVELPEKAGSGNQTNPATGTGRSSDPNTPQPGPGSPQQTGSPSALASGLNVTFMRVF